MSANPRSRGDLPASPRLAMSAARMARPRRDAMACQRVGRGCTAPEPSSRMTMRSFLCPPPLPPGGHSSFCRPNSTERRVAPHTPGEGRAKDPACRRFAARATGWAAMHPARLSTSGGHRVRVVSSVHAAATVPLARPALVPSVGSVGAAVGVATATAAAAASALPIHGGGVSAGWSGQSREHDAVGAQRGGHAGRAGSVDAPAMGIGGRAAPGRAGAGAVAAR
jgi:hypothetical protein